MAEHRVQLVLGDQQFRRLAHEARRRGVTVADVIREAVGRSLPPDDPGRRSAAIGVILAAEPCPVPTDPADIRRALDAARGDQR